MGTYWIEGFLTYSVKVQVEADNPKEAITKAENDEWDSVVEEGRWKDAGGFEALDPVDHPPELVDEDDADPDRDGREATCENCGKPAEYDSELCLCEDCKKLAEQEG